MSSDNHIPPSRFRILTPFYDILLSMIGFTMSFRRGIIELLPDMENVRIVDLGCGTGLMTRLLKERFPKAAVVGIDPDSDALDVAMRNSKKVDVSFLKGGAEQLPLEDKSVDIVFSMLVIHHLPTNTKRKAFREIRRVLKPNGKVCIVDCGRSRGFFSFLYSWFAVTFEHGRDNYEGKIPDFMREAGFKNVRVVDHLRWNVEVIEAKR